MLKFDTVRIPDGYVHKATSENFNGGRRVSIYYSIEADLYLMVLRTVEGNDVEEEGHVFTKTFLELIVHAGKDVLDDLRV